MQPFGFVQPHDLPSAIGLLARGENTMPIAGGTDMIQLLQDSVIAPNDLMDLNDLGLAGIEDDGGGLRIGALTRLSEIAADETIRTRFPVLAASLRETASPQVRHQATAGGNLLQRTRCLYFRDVATPCNKRDRGSGCPAQDGQNRMGAILGGSPHCIAAYPGDMANALVVLDAELELAGPEGKRRILVETLHREPGDAPDIETNLRPGEIITAILLPVTPRARNSHYLKIRDRASFEWPLVSVALAFDSAEDGTIRSARLCAGAVGTRPWRLRRVEQRLSGGKLEQSTAANAADAAAEGADPRPGNAFKVTLLRNAVERVLLMAGGLA
jgi:xanthine dehydrogenase YagS FAD-binding subunit